jgi:hypothetical protein
MPVTLEGISAGNSGQAVIYPPSTGLVVNATNDLGQPMAAQIFVQSMGAVNLTNLSVEGFRQRRYPEQYQPGS